MVHVKVPIAECQLDTRAAADGSLELRLSGPWTTAYRLPPIEGLRDDLARSSRITIAAPTLGEWDSLLIVFLRQIAALAASHGRPLDLGDLPEGARRLLALSTAVPERQGSRRSASTLPFLARLGTATLEALKGGHALLAFVGESALSVMRLCQGRARFRRADFFIILQQCGAQALPIVSLISFLVGMILAYVGAVQLKQFGAQIFVANLVGLGMAREMGAMMTAIIMAGRTGAAFAAQLGTMTVGEEIDALRTSGFSPMDFLVLPRMLALVLMVPLLCLYADLLGILGGAVVAVSSFDLSLSQYYDQTIASLSVRQFALGLLKAAVFGVLVALAGCLRGMQCGRSAAAVGDAATSAVVTGIVWIIVSDASLTILYDILGI
jgi:phospholipid/cholesterol/gamma-HCH transport system permease protein